MRAVLAVVFLLSCQAHSKVPLDPDLTLVVERSGPVAPDRDDELRAYAPVQYLTETAGRGVEGNVDLSASCGCADVGSASSGPGGGPGTGPDVDYGKKANVEVKVILED